MQPKTKRTLLHDLCLFLALLLLALAGFGVWTLTRSRGEMVVVTVNGERWATYPLAEDREVFIPAFEGTGEGNLLVIRDGEVRIASADCRDQICVRHAPIGHVDDAIVCLPHRVVITVEEGGK